MAFGSLILLSVVLMPILNAFANSFYDNWHIFIALETACVIAFAVSFILAGLPLPEPTQRPNDAGGVREQIDPAPAH